MLKETAAARQQGLSQELFYPISTRDRAIPARLAGALGEQARSARQDPEQAWRGQLRLTFRGSAGQGFGVFLTHGVSLHLFGEANDSVGKSMSGGQIVISPHPEARFAAAEQSILGNCALYGATGGRLYAQGRAGDRFAVRNSGATAVVEGAGLHCCEYMTQGLVLVLGPVSDNAGAGMTGGVLFLYGDQAAQVNPAFLQEVPLNRANESELKALLDDYLQATGSARARAILADWAEHRQLFHRFVPLKQAQTELAGTAAPEAQITEKVR
ncbi:MAG: hypothetical protein IGS03_05210 [Candidatus Sericytochromatia bacterium]|nr:hypothetical protein [Candidatus Sericytochromatia bacterium]